MRVPSEGLLLAASRTAAPTNNTSRISFAKIAEPLEVPELLSLQTDSFDWLIGSDAWRERVESELAAGRTDVSTKSGLEEIFEEISPIEDFSETMSLSFRDHRFEPAKYSVEDCKDRDVTYAAPLFVTAEFMNNETGEIKSQTVFMGEFPLMTDKGTFIINGTERVVVSQLVRSPGVYFERTPDKTSDKDIFTARVIPSRGAWLEFEIDKRDMVGVRLDRKRKQSVTMLLKALGFSEEKILETFGQYESVRLTMEKDSVRSELVREDLEKKARDAGVTQEMVDAEVTRRSLIDIYRKLRPGEPPSVEAAQTLLENYYFNPKRYDTAKVQQEDRLRRRVRPADADARRHRRHDPLRRRPARRRDRARDRGRHRPGRGRRHRPLRQPPHAHRGRADPEPAPHRPGAHGARRARADDDPGRRGDHAADPDQHPSDHGGAEGVLRHQPAVAVHGPEQPARGPDAQASSVGPRPGWSVA